MKIIVDEDENQIEIDDNTTDEKWVNVKIGTSIACVSRHELMAALIAFDAKNNKIIEN